MFLSTNVTDCTCHVRSKRRSLLFRTNRYPLFLIFIIFHSKSYSTFSGGRRISCVRRVPSQLLDFTQWYQTLLPSLCRLDHACPTKEQNFTPALGLYKGAERKSGVPGTRRRQGESTASAGQRIRRQLTPRLGDWRGSNWSLKEGH